jgi:hypothetical protein
MISYRCIPNKRQEEAWPCSPCFHALPLGTKSRNVQSRGVDVVAGYDISTSRRRAVRVRRPPARPLLLVTTQADRLTEPPAELLPEGFARPLAQTGQKTANSGCYSSTFRPVAGAARPRVACDGHVQSQAERAGLQGRAAGAETCASQRHQQQHLRTRICQAADCIHANAISQFLGFEARKSRMAKTRPPREGRRTVLGCLALVLELAVLVGTVGHGVASRCPS